MPPIVIRKSRGITPGSESVLPGDEVTREPVRTVQGTFHWHRYAVYYPAGGCDTEWFGCTRCTEWFPVPPNWYIAGLP